MHTESTLYESLEREFCPPLDSWLVATLLAEVEPDESGSHPSPEQLEELRGNFRQLALQAEQDEAHLAEQISAVRLSDDTDSTSTPDSYGRDTSASSANSESSRSSDRSFGSPLGFLQAAFPSLSAETLIATLDHAGENFDEVDLECVVEELLTTEYRLELEERGLSDGTDSDSEQEWHTVKSKRKSRDLGTGDKIGKRMRKPKTIITFGDVMQTQKARPKSNLRSPRSPPGLDPWNQLSSLSTHLSGLLPPHPPSIFQSCFHSPEYNTPYQALRATLTSLRAPHPTEDDRTTMLTIFLDILLPSYEDLDSEQRSRLIDDAELALSVTGGRGEDALDLVKLLHELAVDAESGYLDFGVYHSHPITSSTMPSKATTCPPVSESSPARESKPPSFMRSKPDPFQWQSVPQRKRLSSADPAIAYNNSYTNDGTKIKGSGNGIRKSGTGDLGERRQAQSRRKRMQQGIQQRNELLREASKAWNKGGAKNRGGEVAMYYADCARQIVEDAKKESLEASRLLVEEKRKKSLDGAVDIHGTTVAEAITIVKDILRESDVSPQKPLRIVTGRGTHSVNGVGVLKPAVKNALSQDGWIVGTWDAGLVVRGKKGHAIT